MKFYQLKINLLGAKFQIWRSFVVPAGITLDRLHDIIQIVMGWEDYHVHEFRIDNKIYCDYSMVNEHMEGDGYVYIVDEEIFLSDIVKKGDVIRYVYDLGDNWQHEITVENTNYEMPKHHKYSNYPNIICLQGENACPPEDVGGMRGYFEFCEVLSNPVDPKYPELAQWYGKIDHRIFEKYDPTEFSLNGINEILGTYENWSRDRLASWVQVYRHL